MKSSQWPERRKGAITGGKREVRLISRPDMSDHPPTLTHTRVLHVASPFIHSEGLVLALTRCFLLGGGRKRKLFAGRHHRYTDGRGKVSYGRCVRAVWMWVDCVELGIEGEMFWPNWTRRRGLNEEGGGTGAKVFYWKDFIKALVVKTGKLLCY